MNDDGTMAKGQDLQKFKEKHQLKMITIDDLIEYRKKLEPEIEFKAKVKMPTDFGTFDMYGFKATYTDEEIVVLTKVQFDNMKMYAYILRALQAIFSIVNVVIVVLNLNRL